MTNFNLGTLTSPYREFDLQIAPGTFYTLRYDHQASEVLENNLPDNIEVCYGGSGGFTPVQSGMIYTYPDEQVIPFLQVRNTHPTETMSVKIGLAIGKLDDRRLSVSGTVTVQATPDNPVFINKSPITQGIAGQITIPESGVYLYEVEETVQKVVVQNLSQSAISAFGFVLFQWGCFELDNFKGTVSIFGPAGATAHVGVFK